MGVPDHRQVRPNARGFSLNLLPAGDSMEGTSCPPISKPTLTPACHLRLFTCLTIRGAHLCPTAGTGLGKHRKSLDLWDKGTQAHCRSMTRPCPTSSGPGRPAGAWPCVPCCALALGLMNWLAGPDGSDVPMASARSVPVCVRNTPQNPPQQHLALASRKKALLSLCTF